ncbi:MAG: acetyl-CoA carboxylase biotin carboxyl carrier protein [Melioribacteraceae bacterium]|nr:acetyl-CoA carboxylase biotin carboxyl carrier protein [Melioribacteraceae bacterium]
MDYNLIKKLIKVVEQSDIADFSIQEGDLKIKISKNGKQQIINTAIPQPALGQVQAVQPVAVQVESTESETGAKNTKLHEVHSPIVGTFYLSPSPDADAYVQVGDTVAEGSVLCIVEAMKLMNEIVADASGKIVEILVDNATAVEYNQPLFLIEKN